MTVCITVKHNMHKEEKTHFGNILIYFENKDSYYRIQCLVTLPAHSYPNFSFFLMKKRKVSKTKCHY